MKKYVIVILLLTLIFNLSHFFIKNSKISVSSENHTPAIKNLINSYNNHHFLKNRIIGINSFLKNNLFHTTAVDDVLYGKKKWQYLNKHVFFGTDRMGPDYKHKNLFTKKRLNRYLNLYKNRIEYLHNKNIKYHRAIFPNKQTIYPQYIPERTKHAIVDTVSRVEQLMNHIKKSPLKQHLKSYKKCLTKKSKNTQIYFRNDSHWNEYGAFLMYQKLIKDLNTKDKKIGNPKSYKTKWFTDFESARKETTNLCNGCPNDFHPYGTLYYLHDLKDMQKLPPKLIDSIPFVTPNFPYKVEKIEDDSDGPHRKILRYKNLKAKNNLKLLVFRDSYFNAVTKFMLPHFEEVVLHWSVYDRKIVEKEKPDWVIEATVERQIEIFAGN